MKTKIERLLKSAYAYSAVINANTTNPFSSTRPGKSTRSSSSDAYYDSQYELLEALDSVTAEDLNINQSVSQMIRKQAPVGYMHIHENRWFSLGVFVIFKGGEIPLHDHPGMEGALKVIAGNAKINSYTITAIHDNYVIAMAEPSLILNNSHPPEMLESKKKNIHQIEYNENSTDLNSTNQTYRPYVSFIDFLCPPYGSVTPKADDDACNYYQKISSFVSNENDCTVRLEKSRAPPQYWTDDIPYTAPALHEVIHKLERKYPGSH